MEVKEKTTKIFTIELNEVELNNLVADLEQAKGDWGTGNITNNILNRLKEISK